MSYSYSYSPIRTLTRTLALTLALTRTRTLTLTRDLTVASPLHVVAEILAAAGQIEEVEAALDGADAADAEVTDSNC